MVTTTLTEFFNSLHTNLLYEMQRYGTVANYVSKRFDMQTITKFNLGLGNVDLSIVFSELESELLRIGFIKNGKFGQYNAAKDRMIIPIYDADGQVISFGARATSTKQQPKYINGIEYSDYKKGSVLYNYHNVYGQFNKPLFIVEGYADVFALYKAGYNAVAICGTAFTIDHLELLKPFSHLVFALDNDTAGRNALLRALNIIIEHDYAFFSSAKIETWNIYRSTDPVDIDDFLAAGNQVQTFSVQDFFNSMLNHSYADVNNILLSICEHSNNYKSIIKTA